jgi:hypothetical protein
METVVVRLWTWPDDAIRDATLRGVVRLVRTGEEVPFRGVDELVTILARWSHGVEAEPTAGP